MSVLVVAMAPAQPPCQSPELSALLLHRHLRGASRTVPESTSCQSGTPPLALPAPPAPRASHDGLPDLTTCVTAAGQGLASLLAPLRDHDSASGEGAGQETTTLKSTAIAAALQLAACSRDGKTTCSAH